MQRTDKWSLLAGVRFVLASIVAIKHLDDYTDVQYMGWIANFGTFEAILGFLLISGYSIGVSYLKQPDGFIWRRLQRLYPIYLTSIAAACATFYMKNDPEPNIPTLIINVLFMNQLLTTTSLVGPAWSLSLEFWLYCLTSSFARISQSILRVLVYVSFISFLIYETLRTFCQMPYYAGVGFGANLLFLSFIWVAGFRLARSNGEDKKTLRDVGIIFTSHIALSAFIKFGSRFKHHQVPVYFTHDVLVFAMQSATLLFVFLVFKYLVVPQRPVTGKSRFLRFLGDISYPLYLLHAAVYCVLAFYKPKFKTMLPGMIWHHLAPILFYLLAVLFSALAYWVIDFYSKKHHQVVPAGKAPEKQFVS